MIKYQSFIENALLSDDLTAKYIFYSTNISPTLPISNVTFNEHM